MDIKNGHNNHTGTAKFDDYSHMSLLKRNSVSQHCWQNFEGLTVYAKTPT